MNLSFTGGTQQQRSWFNRALSRCGYPFTALTADVNVSWPAEPSCTGHKEFACTHWDAGSSQWKIEIRNTLDATARSALFYDETCVHELGHVVWFVKTTQVQREAMCPWFSRYVIGEGQVVGVAADLNPLDKAWDLRIQETMAEVFKDGYLKDVQREYDNRTQWKIDPARWHDLFLPLVPPGTEKTITYSEGVGG